MISLMPTRPLARICWPASDGLLEWRHYTEMDMTDEPLVLHDAPLPSVARLTLNRAKARNGRTLRRGEIEARRSSSPVFWRYRTRFAHERNVCCGAHAGGSGFARLSDPQLRDQRAGLRRDDISYITYMMERG